MKFEIGNIDVNKKVLIIAELSANHNQDFEVAVKTIEAAADCGADAIKLQTYTPDTITLDCDNENFKIQQGTIWDGKTLYNLYKEAYTPWEWQPKLKEIAESLGLICFSSPFDFSSVDFLEKMNVPAYKIASFEITDIPLIEYAAKKGKPVIISTGIATVDDIQLALDTCRKAGNNQISLLKCTSAYPAPVEEANLVTIPDLASKFNVVPGLSDHAKSEIVPVVAVSLGARIIEKHFIINRNIGGPDASFSLQPDEFKKMANNIREAELSMGNVNYELSEKTLKNRHFSRSLYCVKDIKAGEMLTSENIKSIRPGNGLHTRYFWEIMGKRARINISKGTPLHLEMIK